MFTSGKISHDPEPYVAVMLSGESGAVHFADPSMAYGCQTRYAPRPEFDNHNPILVEFRNDPRFTAPERAVEFLLYLIQHPGNVRRYYNPEHIDHARRVLTKLAALG